MPRRSRFAVAAEAWMKSNAKSGSIPSRDLWDGLCKDYPELTTSTPDRKTPRATCMRDLRKDKAFSVGGGLVSLR